MVADPTAYFEEKLHACDLAHGYRESGDREHELQALLQTFQLAVCYAKRGKLKEAYEHNEIALTYAPEDSNSLENRQLLLKHLRIGRARKIG